MRTRAVLIGIVPRCLFVDDDVDENDNDGNDDDYATAMGLWANGDRCAMALTSAQTDFRSFFEVL